MNVIVNGERLNIPESVTSLAELLNHFSLDASVTVAEINQRIIDRSSYSAVSLSENDVIELIRFMGGGQLSLSSPRPCLWGIYPVVTNGYTGQRSVEEVIWHALNGGARVVQLRLKNVSDLEFFETGLKAREMTRKFDAALIINDRVDLALSLGADGVHLGQSDIPVRVARKLMGPDKIIGLSTHTVADIEHAELDGATYVNIGPLFPTQTKTTSVKALGLDMLRQCRDQCHLPFTVMGGIKISHLNELKALGVKNVAMVTEITQAGDIAATVRECNRIMLG